MMHPEQRALLDGIIAHPDDDVRRGAYAQIKLLKWAKLKAASPNGRIDPKAFAESRFV